MTQKEKTAAPAEKKAKSKAPKKASTAVAIADPADQNQVALQQVAQPNNLLAAIMRATTNPEVDPQKMLGMIDVMERLEKREAEKEFNSAMAELQPQIPTFKHTAAVRNKTGVQSTYTKYEDIDKVVRPLYTALGFSVSFGSKTIDGQTYYTGTISHRAGHSRSAEIPLAVDTGPGRNTVQAQGSTITYSKRYLLAMLLNIVTTGADDDGNGATKKISTEQAAEIDVLLRETGADRSRFFDYLGGGRAYTDDVLQIDAVDFKMAITNLRAKKDAMARNNPEEGKTA